MKCSICGTDNRNDDVFCTNCGAKIEQTQDTQYTVSTVMDHRSTDVLLAASESVSQQSSRNIPQTVAKSNSEAPAYIQPDTPAAGSKKHLPLHMRVLAALVILAVAISGIYYILASRATPDLPENSTQDPSPPDQDEPEEEYIDIDQPIYGDNLNSVANNNSVNGGFVAFEGDWIYFIMGGSIYKTSTTATETTTICSDFEFYSIIIEDGRLYTTCRDVSYYYIITMNLDATDRTILAESAWFITSINPMDFWVYYTIVSDDLSRTELRKVHLGTASDSLIIEFDSSIHSVNVIDEWVFFYNETMGICRIRSDGHNFSILMERDSIRPSNMMVVAGDCIYFDSDSSICCILTDGTCKTTVCVEDSAEIRSIYFADGWIYYLLINWGAYDNYSDYNADSFRVCKVVMDGSAQTQLFDSDYSEYHLKCRSLIVKGSWVYLATGKLFYYLQRISIEGSDFQRLDVARISIEYPACLIKKISRRQPG